MKLNVKSLVAGLEYHGPVEGKRQKYYVLSSRKQYLLMSESRSRSKRAAGYFNLVDRVAVDQLHRRLRGQSGVTAKLVYTRSRDHRAVPSALMALNMLYVLVATGRAKLDSRHSAAKELFFNVHA